MFYKGLMTLFLLCTTTIYGYAYSDFDVDGVEDSIDECPNTPFDILVDETGCEEGKTYRGTLTLLGGLQTSMESDGNITNNASMLMNYSYNAWDISLFSFYDVQDDNESTYYIDVGYGFDITALLSSKLSIGTKQSTLQNDYYFSTMLSYDVSQKDNLYLLYSYTLAQDSSDERYNNFHTLSLGVSRSMTQHWNTGLSYDYSGASLEESSDYSALNWSNTFLLSEHTYVLGTYSYGLSDAASAHTFSIQLGIDFD